jgi:hypothetical protein
MERKNIANKNTRTPVSLGLLDDDNCITVVDLVDCTLRVVGPRHIEFADSDGNSYVITSVDDISYLIEPDGKTTQFNRPKPNFVSSEPTGGSAPPDYPPSVEQRLEDIEKRLFELIDALPKFSAPDSEQGDPAVVTQNTEYALLGAKIDPSEYTLPSWMRPVESWYMTLSGRILKDHHVPRHSFHQVYQIFYDTRPLISPRKDEPEQ